MKKNIFKKLGFGFISILTILSFYYLWKINHVPEGLELRSWFRISLGCWLIFFWQISVVVSVVILINRLRANLQSYFLRIVLCACVLIAGICTTLYLTWNFFGIYIANEKDSETPNGTLTVYHDNDFLRPNDYSYRLYEKEGLLYRRYMRDMVDEHDYAVSGTDSVPDDSTGESLPAEPSSALDAPELAFDVIENRETKLVFNRSLNDFIDCYNQYYRTDHHTPYLQPASEWRNLVYPSAIHSDHETVLYEFSFNPKIWSQPTITAYVLTNDVVWYYYPNTLPEVTSYRMNADGTMTMRVEVLSTDLKTDCLFSHDVTVRPLENGSFQYVGNKITYQTEYGLPPAESCFEVDRMGLE